MRTRVYLTVDVECAEERIRAGRIQPPLGYDLRMWGRFANQRQDLGVGLIRRELKKRGLRATFFVEPLGSSHFGLPGLTEVCTFLRDGGHDVQLHTHPVQRNATFRSKGVSPYSDDIGSYSEAEQAKLLSDGISILAQTGIPKDDILAFRAGNFGATNSTWAAMRQAGLRVSSNYNPCYFNKNCKMRYAQAEAGLFPSPVEGVWELPITCFEEVGIAARGSLRHMQIAAVTAQEMIECMRQCRALCVGEVTIVTHSFEFYFIDSPEAKLGHVNHINLARLGAVLDFLARNSHDFDVETVGALAQRVPSSPESRRQPHMTFPRGKPTDRYRRFAEQAIKRAEMRLRFP